MIVLVVDDCILLLKSLAHFSVHSLAALGLPPVHFVLLLNVILVYYFPFAVGLPVFVAPFLGCPDHAVVLGVAVAVGLPVVLDFDLAEPAEVY